MQVGDLVKAKYGIEHPFPYGKGLGVIVRIPPEDEKWGKSFVVQWSNGYKEEILLQYIKEMPCK